MSADRDRFAGPALKAAEHVAAVAGAISFFRDLADDMHRVANNNPPVAADNMRGTIAGWVERFDFLSNAVAVSNDELIEELQKARVPSVLCSGSYVARNELSPADGEG